MGYSFPQTSAAVCTVLLTAPHGVRAAFARRSDKRRGFWTPWNIHNDSAQSRPPTRLPSRTKSSPATHVKEETRYLASILTDTINISCKQEERSMHSKWNERWPTEVTSNTYLRGLDGAWDVGGRAVRGGGWDAFVALLFVTVTLAESIGMMLVMMCSLTSADLSGPFQQFSPPEYFILL